VPKKEIKRFVFFKKSFICYKFILFTNIVTPPNPHFSFFKIYWQAYEWELHLAKARADKHDEIFQAVLRVRREAQERYNDPDGLTVKQRQKVNEEERIAKNELEKEKEMMRIHARENKNMEDEDDLSWDLREAERELVQDRLRRVAKAKEERQQEIDRPLMIIEDERSAAKEQEYIDIAIERARIKKLENQAFGTAFVPYYKDNDTFALISKSLVKREKKFFKKKHSRNKKIIYLPKESKKERKKRIEDEKDADKGIVRSTNSLGYDVPLSVGILSMLGMTYSDIAEIKKRPSSSPTRFSRSMSMPSLEALEKDGGNYIGSSSSNNIGITNGQLMHQDGRFYDRPRTSGSVNINSTAPITQNDGFPPSLSKPTIFSRPSTAETEESSHLISSNNDRSSTFLRPWTPDSTRPTSSGIKVETNEQQRQKLPEINIAHSRPATRERPAGQNGAPLIGALVTEANTTRNAWKRPGTSPVKAGIMRSLMSYSDSDDMRPLTSPVRSRRRPRHMFPVKNKMKNRREEEQPQPFYRGLFGIKGAKKKISSSTSKSRSGTVKIPSNVS
jgi:hypothetical protein